MVVGYFIYAINPNIYVTSSSNDQGLPQAKLELKFLAFVATVPTEEQLTHGTTGQKFVPTRHCYLEMQKK